MFKLKRFILLFVGVLALSFMLSGCKSNSKELIAAIESLDIDTVLAQLADGANPDSKSDKKQTAINIAIEKALQYDQERIALFKTCIESANDNEIKVDLKNKVIKSKRYFDELLKKGKQSKTLSERAENQGHLKMALSYYLLFGNLSSAYKKDPTTIKKVIIDTYESAKTTDSLRGQLRGFVFYLKSPHGDALRLACKNYSKAYYISNWLTQVGANVTIKNIDGTLPIARLEAAKLKTFAKQLTNSSKYFDKKKIKDIYKELVQWREIIKKANFSFFIDQD